MQKNRFWLHKPIDTANLVRLINYISILSVNKKMEFCESKGQDQTKSVQSDLESKIATDGHFIVSRNLRIIYITVKALFLQYHIIIITFSL